MSSVDKAKRQAKRLLALSKNHQKKNNYILSIPTYNHSLEIISIINGYQNWHDYHLNLEKEDLNSYQKDKNKKNKEMKIPKSYFMDYEIYDTYKKIKKSSFDIIPKEHLPIIIGHEKKNKAFFGKKHVENGWLLNEYPVFITGSPGAGTPSSLMSFANQYIKNNEGVIYFTDRVADYSHFFSISKQHNRLNELYLIWIEKRDNIKLPNLHTFDPINPMVDDSTYFIKFFDITFGKVIQSLIREHHKKDKLISVDDLKSFTDIENLIKFGTQFNNQEIQEYLDEIGYIDELNEDILKIHFKLSNKASKMINLLVDYNYLFSCKPTIDLEDIFLNRKILQVITYEYNEPEILLLNSLVAHNILHMDNKIKNKHHFQNIIFYGFNLYLNDEDVEKIEKLISITRNNYIFSTDNWTYDDGLFTTKIAKICPTFICMKLNNYKLPDYLKIKALDTMESVPPIFYYNKTGYNKNSIFNKQWLNPQDLKEGQMYIFCDNKKKSDEDIINNQEKFYITLVDSIYIKPKKIDNVYLYPHKNTKKLI